MILALLMLFAFPQTPKESPKPVWAEDQNAALWNGVRAGTWVCPEGFVSYGNLAPPNTDPDSKINPPACREKTLPPPVAPPKQSPLQRGSLIPRVPDPEHLEQVQLDLTFTVATKHWFWTSHEPLLGRFEVAQKRSKEGWCSVYSGGCGGERDTNVNGVFKGALPIDATWRNPTVLMLVWKDKDNRPLDQITIEVPNDELQKGVKREITFTLH